MIENKIIRKSRAVYPPANMCIYCGEINVELTLEHIIPESLGGGYELPQASCEACRGITSSFERVCARKMFGWLRKQLGIGKKKNKKKWPENVEIEVELPDGNTIYKLIPAKECLYTLYLCAFELPDILKNLPKSKEFHNVTFWNKNFFTDEMLKNFVSKYGVGIYNTGQFVSDEFLRLLAKIAHGWATAELGAGNFQPYLCDLIRFGSETPSYWIGGKLEIAKESNPSQYHLLNLSFQRIPNELDPKFYLIVNLRLFSQFGTPEYIIVVGELTDQQRQILVESNSLKKEFLSYY